MDFMAITDEMNVAHGFRVRKDKCVQSFLVRKPEQKSTRAYMGG
jgi:hypothetical protein